MAKRTSKTGSVSPNPVVESSESAAVESPATASETVSNQEKKMITLNRGRVGKSGKNAMYTSPLLRRGVRLPKNIFADDFPETISLDLGDNVATLSAEEQAKVEARAAKRAAKADRPKPSTEERQAALAARSEKLELRLQKTREAQEKLAAKLAANSTPVAEPVLQ